MEEDLTIRRVETKSLGRCLQLTKYILRVKQARTVERICQIMKLYDGCQDATVKKELDTEAFYEYHVDCITDSSD